eukprot:431148-Rhodomonas_salina.1
MPERVLACRVDAGRAGVAGAAAAPPWLRRRPPQAHPRLPPPVPPPHVAHPLPFSPFKPPFSSNPHSVQPPVLQTPVLQTPVLSKLPHPRSLPRPAAALAAAAATPRCFESEAADESGVYYDLYDSTLLGGDARRRVPAPSQRIRGSMSGV